METREALRAALQALKAQGAEYADARWERHRSERILVRNGQVAALTQHEDEGFGIRVLYKGAWGFASSPFLTEQEIERVARRALEIAQASALTAKEPIRLDDWEPQRGQYESPCERDPFAIPLDRKLELLFRADEILRKAPEVQTAESFLRFRRVEKLFLSSDGAEIAQRFVYSGGGLEVKAVALQLLKADPCPAGEFDVILDTNQLALQIHESCGHPTELDRALGMELSFAGGRGLFVGYLSSRDTAPRIGQRSTGACRAESWNRVPIVRMVNISLEPDPNGPSLEELIADTKRGLLLSTNKVWSIDDRRLNFQFGCEIAWEIKDGKLGRVLKNPVYTGITPEFWGSCDAVCHPKEWRMWGLTNCGKGEHPHC